MNNYLPYFRLPKKKTTANSTTSCLTINQPEAPLGLANLLDIIRHDISQEHDRQLHRLTFSSGHTLYIEANSHGVTVRGTDISSTDSACGKLTLLLDPGKHQPVETKGPV